MLTSNQFHQGGIHYLNGIFLMDAADIWHCQVWLDPWQSQQSLQESCQCLTMLPERQFPVDPCNHKRFDGLFILCKLQLLFWGHTSSAPDQNIVQNHNCPGTCSLPDHNPNIHDWNQCKQMFLNQWFFNTCKLVQTSDNDLEQHTPHRGSLHDVHIWIFFQNMLKKLLLSQYLPFKKSVKLTKGTDIANH